MSNVLTKEGQNKVSRYFLQHGNHFTKLEYRCVREMTPLLNKLYSFDSGAKSENLEVMAAIREVDSIIDKDITKIFDRGMDRPICRDFIIEGGGHFILILIGLLNGLLPCGLVYVAIAGAINTNSVVMGVIFMVLFGLGTVPLMLSVLMGGNIISLNLRNRMKRIVPYFIVLLGILFILQGMSLGIPYVSPKAEKLKPKEVVMKNEDCCM